MTYRGPARATTRSLASPSAPGARHASPSGRLLAAVALVALVGAGCADAPAGTGTGGDAGLAATGVPTGAAADQTGPEGPPPSPAELDEQLQQRRESAECMRENGVEDFPDPDAEGHILYYGDDPDMESAREKCGNREPGDRTRHPGYGG